MEQLNTTEYGGDRGVPALRLSWERHSRVSYDEQEWTRICGNFQTISKTQLLVGSVVWMTLVHVLWTCPKIY